MAIKELIMKKIKEKQAEEGDDSEVQVNPMEVSPDFIILIH
jgi:hypothetical protein